MYSKLSEIKYYLTLKLPFQYLSFLRSLCFFITAQKMKFSIKDFFSKCDQIRSFLCSFLRSFLWIWLHLLQKSLIENFIFFVVHFSACGTLPKNIFTGKTEKNAYFKPFLGNFYLSSENMVQIA